MRYYIAKGDLLFIILRESSCYEPGYHYIWGIETFKRISERRIPDSRQQVIYMKLLLYKMNRLSARPSEDSWVSTTAVPSNIPNGYSRQPAFQPNFQRSSQSNFQPTSQTAFQPNFQSTFHQTSQPGQQLGLQRVLPWNRYQYPVTSHHEVATSPNASQQAIYPQTRSVPPMIVLIGIQPGHLATEHPAFASHTQQKNKGWLKRLKSIFQ